MMVNAVIEAVDPITIPPTSMLDNLHSMWMCIIWMCPYLIMAALADPAFGSELESWVWVTPLQQMMVMVKCSD